MNHTSSSKPQNGLDSLLRDTAKRLSSRSEIQKHATPAPDLQKDLELEKVNLIIDTALKLDPAHRKQFVEKSCGANNGLKERVLALIKRCGTSPPPGFLQPPVGLRKVVEKVYDRCAGKQGH